MAEAGRNSKINGCSLQSAGRPAGEFWIGGGSGVVEVVELVEVVEVVVVEVVV